MKMITKKEFCSRLKHICEFEKAIEDCYHVGVTIEVHDEIMAELVDMFVGYVLGADNDARDDNLDLCDDYLEEIWSYIVKYSVLSKEEKESAETELYDKAKHINEDINT